MDLTAPRKRARFEIIHTLDAKKDFSGSLSDEMIMLILSFVDPRDLAVASRLNRRWAKVASDQSLWRRLFAGSYSETLPPKRNTKPSDSGGSLCATRIMQVQEVSNRASSS